MLAETEPPKIFPRILYKFDLITLYFALIFGSYGAAQLASFGWASIPMLLIATITFLLPCALAAYELGTLFPGEGGIYIWAHKTAGSVHGFISGWLSWIPIFFLLPLGSSTVVAHLQVLFDTKFSVFMQVFLQLAHMCVVLAISLFNLRTSQNYIRIMFFVSLFTAVAVFLCGAFNNAKGTPINSDIISIDLTKHGAVYSAAVLWLLGVEVPFNMSAEFRENKKSIGQMFLWGTLFLVVAYTMGIAGVLWTTPQADIDSTTGVAKGVMNISPFVGSIVSVAIILAVSSQDVAYMNSYSRLVLISGIEKRLPSVFARVTPRGKVPLPAMILQLIGAFVIIIIFASQPNLTVAFNYYIASLIVVWCTALFYIYFGVVRARISLQDQYKQRGNAVWKIPFGMTGVLVVALWGSIFNCLAIYYVFAIPMAAEVEPHLWRTNLGILSFAVTLVGILIYFVGRKNASVS